MGLFSSIGKLFGGGQRQEMPTFEKNIPSFANIRRETGSEGFPDITRLATRAAKGEQNVPGIGFGPEFLDRASNPLIQREKNRLQREVLPGIASDFSSRGLGRSAGGQLATGALQRGRENSEQRINELLSHFFVLNEAQKKTDITQGINLGTQQQGAFLQTGVAQQAEELEQQQARSKIEQANIGLEREDAAAGFQAAMAALGVAAPALAGGLAGSGGAGGALMGTKNLGKFGTGMVNNVPFTPSTFGPGNVPRGIQSVVPQASSGGNFLSSLVGGVGNIAGQLAGSQLGATQRDNDILDLLLKRGFHG